MHTPLREELFFFTDLQFENLSKLNPLSSTIRFLVEQRGEVCFFSPSTPPPHLETRDNHFPGGLCSSDYGYKRGDCLSELWDWRFLSDTLIQNK